MDKPKIPEKSKIIVKKANKGGGQAFKAFRTAIRGHDVHDIAEGYRKFLAECEGKEKKFIPYAATWLNGKRWLDDYEAPKVTKDFGL